MARAQVDHVVVVVSSLAEATARFSAAGLTVTPGGRHDAVPTENALVGFADGSYLELLAARDGATRDELRALRGGVGWERHLKGVSAIARRFLPLLAGPNGVADWVLTGEPLTRRAAALRARGIRSAGPVAMRRARADGESLEWQLLLPESPLQPIWIADRTPREWRVPSDAHAVAHANGANGIAAVRVVARSAALAALELGETLGLVPRIVDGVSTLAMGGTRIEVVEGERHGACGVALRGCARLPDALTELGVTAEG